MVRSPSNLYLLPLTFLNEVQFLGQCPICNSKYGQGESSVIDKTDDAFSVYAECPQCKSSVIVVVMGGLRGMVTTIGMLTDLEREDVDRIKDAPALTLDDALELHMSLEKKSKKTKRSKT